MPIRTPRTNKKNPASEDVAKKSTDTDEMVNIILTHTLESFFEVPTAPEDMNIAREEPYSKTELCQILQLGEDCTDDLAIAQVLAIKGFFTLIEGEQYKISKTLFA